MKITYHKEWGIWKRCFTLRTHEMISVHNLINVTFFEKLRFKMFSFYMKTKSRRLQILSVWRAFLQAPFSWRISVDSLTVEIKLRFQILSEYCRRRLNESPTCNLTLLIRQWKKNSSRDLCTLHVLNSLTYKFGLLKCHDKLSKVFFPRFKNIT